MSYFQHLPEINLKFPFKVLKKLLEQAQAQQMKEIEAIFDRENKEMKTGQARASVETAREIQNDKSLKSKAEKDRRLREKHSNNTKVRGEIYLSTFL